MSDDLSFLFESQNLYLGTGESDPLTKICSELAKAAGHAVGHIVYPGSGISSEPHDIYELDIEHLKEANRYLMRANKSMHRSWPRQQLAQDNALRRDMWLVKWAYNVYVIGLFTQDASLLKIQNDTGWPAQIYVDRFIYDREPMPLCHLYLFDQKSEAWWRWEQQWNRVQSPDPANGIYTVFGPEKLTNAGRAALHDIWPSINQQ